MRAGLVGRETHRTTLETLRAGALRGDGAIVLLVGEAGIGKSALAEAAARRAAGAGMQVLGGRAVADEGAPAFWPWPRALGQAREGGVAGLTPELLDLYGETGTSPAESAATRFVAIEATIAARAERRRPGSATGQSPSGVTGRRHRTPGTTSTGSPRSTARSIARPA